MIQHATKSTLFLWQMFTRMQPLLFLVKWFKLQNICVDQSEKNKTDYLPDGYEDTDLGVSADTTITGWTQALH